MPIAKLSKRVVDALVAGPRPYITYDTELKGFGVKLTPSGMKTWIIEYRAGAGGRRAPKKRLFFLDGCRVIGRLTMPAY
jgi:hypothetical protein